MFAYIKGIVAEKNQDTLVIDVNGVGFELFVSNATLVAAPAVGETMMVHTIYNVREDAAELFGFYSKDEKKLYERLCSVSGIGSRTALSVLSSMSVRDLSVALVTGDVNALCRVPGIGKKSAQRLILELKDKVEDAQLTGAAAVAPKVASKGIDAEAIAALVGLGYSSAEAAKAVSAVADRADTVDKLIYLALKSVGG